MMHVTSQGIELTLPGGERTNGVQMAPPRPFILTRVRVHPDIAIRSVRVGNLVWKEGDRWRAEPNQTISVMWEEPTLLGCEVAFEGQWVK